MDEHPDFKGQVQFSGQTFKSLQQAAPNVIAHENEVILDSSLCCLLCFLADGGG